MITINQRKDGITEYIDDVENKSQVKSRKEHLEQIDLNNFCAKLFPEHYGSMYHVVNESGGKGSAFYGAKLNEMGRKSGVPDWPVMVPSKGYHGLYVELKRTRRRDSTVSKEQVKFMQRQQALGYKCVFAFGYRCALQAIKDYLTDE